LFVGIGFRWLWKDNLTSDSKQYHWYQQNLSPQSNEDKKTYDISYWKSSPWLRVGTKMWHV
jgi:hypothetical protein